MAHSPLGLLKNPFLGYMMPLVKKKQVLILPSCVALSAWVSAIISSHCPASC